MRIATTLLLLSLAPVLGCDGTTTTETDLGAADTDTDTDTDADTDTDTDTDTDADTDTDTDSDPSYATDVQPILAQYCSGCHGNGGCSSTVCFLDDYATATGNAANQGQCSGLTVGECIPVRIRNGTMPRPSGCLPDAPGCITTAELTVVDDWVAGGMLP